MPEPGIQDGCAVVVDGHHQGETRHGLVGADAVRAVERPDELIEPRRCPRQVLGKQRTRQERAADRPFKERLARQHLAVAVEEVDDRVVFQADRAVDAREVALVERRGGHARKAAVGIAQAPRGGCDQFTGADRAERRGNVQAAVGVVALEGEVRGVGDILAGRGLHRVRHEPARRVGPGEVADHGRTLLQAAQGFARRGAADGMALPDQLDLAQRPIDGLECAHRVLRQHLRKAACRLLRVLDSRIVSAAQVEQERDGDGADEQDAGDGRRAVRAVEQVSELGPHRCLWNCYCLPTSCCCSPPWRVVSLIRRSDPPGMLGPRRSSTTCYRGKEHSSEH